MLGRILALILKELLTLLRDPKGRMVLIGPPLIQLFVFAHAATQEVRNVTVAVLDRDHGAWSRELIQRLEGSPTFTRVLHLQGTPELQAAIDVQTALLALHIPPDFSRTIATGGTAQLQIIIDGRRANAGQIVQGYINRIVEQMGTEVAAGTGRSLPPATVVTRNWFNANLDYTWFTVPSLMGVLTMVVGIIVTALSIAREREVGTYDQLLVSPLTPFEILVGKTVPALIVGLAQGTLILLAAIFAFRIPFAGSLVLLYASMALFLAAVIGIGLFISSLAHTQQQAILYAFVFVSPAVLISGFMTPVENMPAWLQALAQLVPLTHFLRIAQGIFVAGMPADMVAASAWPMALIAFVTLTGAALLFRSRLG